MVFYAYLIRKDIDSQYRYVITAPSVEIIDEWYRLTREDGFQLERQSPEFYIFPWVSNWPWDWIYDSSKKASKMRYKIFFTRFNDLSGVSQMTFAGQFAPDHGSGKTFYVRSKSNPSVFWTADGGNIYAAKHSRTKFKIERWDKSDGVLIPSDRIRIYAMNDPKGYPYVVHGQEGNFLSTANGPGQGQGPNQSFWSPLAQSSFEFKDFKDRFLPFGKEDSQTNAQIMFVPGGYGEEWELVS